MDYVECAYCTQYVILGRSTLEHLNWILDKGEDGNFLLSQGIQIAPCLFRLASLKCDVVYSVLLLVLQVMLEYVVKTSHQVHYVSHPNSAHKTET